MVKRQTRMRPTLSDQFFLDQAKVGASGELSTILNRITLAGRMICNEIQNAGLLKNLGYTGDVNVQDEEQRALDVISDEIFIDVFSRTGSVAALASEEMEDVHHFKGHEDGKYVLLHDPLDGSGNVDVNGSMGTIFSVHRRVSSGGPATLEDFFQQGSAQVAAGYVLYGPATLFVYTVGGPVHVFTQDKSVGAFFLTESGLEIPTGKGSYAVNEANAAKWTPAMRDLVEGFKSGSVGEGKRSARYVGALVADLHRTLVQGGIYMYPGEVAKPQGKLRLLYEAAPLAMIARQCGGHATDGIQDILDIVPNELHQRTPLFIGARDDVELATRALA